ncbi:hypothetical protein ACFQ4C_02235 [Larkinella insperata]|uniref:Uncharacterized protein n=1 Tax=Larkinella insperata TaxID=332158 RepID=A0ABW3Q303_9BACT|nr:hypothetical protein [Larkinella insperata]
MKHLFTIILLSQCFLSVTVLAQQKSAKTYVAIIGNAGSVVSPDFKRRNDEIKFQARTRINKDLLEFFNLLIRDDLGENERNYLIQNSYLPNPQQIFNGDGVVVEDDIDPNHTSAENVVDIGIERYLRNLDLFYSKSDSATIAFSNIVVSDVKEGKEHPYLKVFFTQKFNGRNKQVNLPYKAVQRVAELRAEKVNGKWQTLITRLGFLRPEEFLSPLQNLTIPKDFGPKRPVKGTAKIFHKVDTTIDTLGVNWDKQWLQVVRSTIPQLPIGFYQRSKTGSNGKGDISMTLIKNEQKLIFHRNDGAPIAFDRVKDPKETDRLKLKYRRNGWLQIAAGLAALGISYRGYTNLQKSYDTYHGELARLNAEYAIWKDLSQQPAGNPITSMNFNSYSRPGIYAVYGGGVVGAGLILNGIRQLIKAGKL